MVRGEMNRLLLGRDEKIPPGVHLIDLVSSRVRGAASRVEDKYRRTTQRVRGIKVDKNANIEYATLYSVLYIHHINRSVFSHDTEIWVVTSVHEVKNTLYGNQFAVAKSNDKYLHAARINFAGSCAQSLSY